MTERPWVWGDIPTVWVLHKGWRLLPNGGKCRRPRCQNPAVAELKRVRRSGAAYWWAYCADHMYGGRIEDGVVLTEVFSDSRAAERGWCE